MNMQDFKNYFAKDLYGISIQEAQKDGICVNCREPAFPKCYSTAGRREYMISGLCEKCFDEIYYSRLED